MDGKAIAISSILVKETEELRKLLVLLEEQHELLINNDILKLEEIVDRIQLCNKGVAEGEVERRKLTNNQPMKDIILEINDLELEENYRKIIKLLNEVKVQKETNDMLIKMGLGFSAKMLGILKPADRNNTTYSSHGKYKK
jgi:hypothetical protein